MDCIFPVAYAMLTCHFQRTCSVGLTGHAMHTSFCTLMGFLCGSLMGFLCGSDSNLEVILPVKENGVNCLQWNDR